MNLSRKRAEQKLDMATAIGLALAGDIKATAMEMLAAGASDKVVRKWAGKAMGRKAMESAKGKMIRGH